MNIGFLTVVGIFIFGIVFGIVVGLEIAEWIAEDKQ